MSEVNKGKREDKLSRSDRIAREYIMQERRAREKKTAKLRALRLKEENTA